MYKIITILLVYLSSFCSLFADRRYDKITDPNTQQVKKVYWNGIKTKKFKNGAVRRSRTYKDGKLHGTALKYNKRGVKIREKQYKNGQLNGLKISYRRDGSLHKKEIYVNGKLQGKSIRYRLDGKTVRRSENYKNGIRSGVQDRFYANGSLKSKIVFRIGGNGKEQIHGSYVVYYNDKKLKYEVLYENGKKNGIAKFLFANGIIRFEKCYVQGKKQAGIAICKKQTISAETITRNYKNGKPSTIFQVKDGKRHGMYRRYDNTGKLTSTTQYDEGKVVNTKKF